MSNADAAFDFEDSFWRYELSLARQYGVQPPPGGKVSPYDALLELRRPDMPEVAPKIPSTAVATGDGVGAGSTVATATTVHDMHDNAREVEEPVHVRADPLTRADHYAASTAPPDPSLLSSAPASTLPSFTDVTPLARLQTMFQGVRSRAVSPARSPGEELEGTNAAMRISEGTETNGWLAPGRTEGDTFDFTLMPDLPEERLPFTWNFWDEQGTAMR